MGCVSTVYAVMCVIHHRIFFSQEMKPRSVVGFDPSLMSDSLYHEWTEVKKVVDNYYTET